MNLINLLRHISLGHVRLQKLRLFIAAAGICLGVATMVSIDLVSGSVLHSFQSSIDRIAGRAALQVTGAQSGFPDKMLELVQKVPGVEYGVPVIQTYANFAGGSRRAVMILGIDTLEDHHMRQYSLSGEGEDIPDPLMFLARPDSILLTRSMAKREGIRMGQKIRLQTVEGIKTFKVRGLLKPDGPARAAAGDVAVMDIFAAEKVFGMGRLIDRIDVRLLPGEQLDVMKRRIERALPAGYKVETPAARGREIGDFLAYVKNCSGITGWLAILVGMYLIYNVVSISVVQRRKEIGILRALGARRGELIGLLLAETFTVALFGALVGIGLGLLFARSVMGVTAQVVSQTYARVHAGAILFPWKSALLDGSIGIAASLAAALPPAVSIVRVTPVSAIRSVSYSQDNAQLGAKAKIASALCFFLSVLILAVYRTIGGGSGEMGMAAAFFAMALIMLGVSFSTPVFLKWFTRAFRRLFLSSLGAEGRLAGLNLSKGISRNSVAVAAVFFSICLFVSTANVIASWQNSFLTWFDSAVRADILVSSGYPLATAGSPDIPMPASMLQEFEKIPGVLSAEPYRKIYIPYKSGRVLLEVEDVALRMSYCPQMIVEGSRKRMARLLPNRDNVVVSEAFAAKYHVKPGDSIRLPTPGGLVSFGVAAVVVSYGSSSGVIMMDINTYRRHWLDDLVDTYELRMRPGTSISSVRAQILDTMGKKRRLFVLDVQQFKEEARKIIDSNFHLFDAINIITLIIAGFGIVVTLLASVLERTREIGILRSIGMTRLRISAVVILESVLIGAAGGILGLFAGTLVGWIELDGVFRPEFGATLAYSIHWGSLAGALSLSVVFAALAGFYPARRAAKTNIVEALSYE